MTLIQDLRYAIRMLRKAPGFTLIAVASLALGIGLNTSIFSLVNVFLIRPVPVVRDQDRLVWLRAPISYPNFVDYRALTKSFNGMAAASGTSEFSLTQKASPELVTGEYVTENYFDVLGIAAVKGRTFQSEEGQSPIPVVVISDHLWRTRFDSDTNVIGKQISLNGIGFTIIGVTPSGFIGTEVGLNRALWVPLAMHSTLNPPDITSESTFRSDKFQDRNSHWLAVFGRLKTGLSQEQAAAELRMVARNLAETYSGSATDERLRSVQLLQMSGGMDPRDRQEALPVAGIVFGVVGLVLLIACVNIASLLVARAAVRRRETAIKQALGATRRRLVRQWLTESIVLGIAGGALGLLIATWSNRVLISNLQSTPLGSLDLGLDWRVLGFTFVISILTSITFGLTPALQASRSDLVSALKSENAFSRGARRSRLRTAFVTTQLALSFMLLIGAGLFIRALQKATTIDPGFRVDRALTVPLNLGLLRYSEKDGENFYRTLMNRVGLQPGVEGVSMVRFAQLGFSFAQYQVFPEGRDSGPTDEGISTGFNVVGQNYFKTMEIPLLRGRDFNEADHGGAPGVVVINATLAGLIWPGEEALGKRLSLTGSKGPFLEVVGVARDGKYRSLSETPRPQIFQPVLQSYSPKMTLIVRTTGEPKSVVTMVREQIRSLERNLPISEVNTLNDQLSLSLFPSRVAAFTLGGFGILALLLAGIGIYGVVSYSVAQRTREFGIRLALGAKQRNVLRLVIGEALFVVLLGLSIGVVLALALTQVIADFLYGVPPTDPITFAVVLSLWGVIALAATYIPARRATRVDPLVALRYE